MPFFLPFFFVSTLIPITLCRRSAFTFFFFFKFSLFVLKHVLTLYFSSKFKANFFFSLKVKVTTKHVHFTHMARMLLLKSIHFWNNAFSLYENKVLQLMPAGASKERFGEKDPVFIKWRFCRHFLKNKWTLKQSYITLL